ncbi:MAG: hypothetical protein U1E26_03410 [Coriobacteriia bacterium]|nr:hypothetical protein [Coriobacteriia bacterium]
MRPDEAAAALYLPTLYRLGRRPYPELMRALIATERLDSEQLNALQMERLQSLLAHCYEYVPYYRRLFDELGAHPDDIRSLDDYARLPVLEKETLRANLASFIATNQYGKRLSSVATSGSTGTPLVYHHDPRYFLHGWAALMRNMSWTGFRLGERQAWLAYSAPGGVKRAFRLALERKWQARELVFSEETIASWAHHLATWRPTFVYGAPSSRLAPIAAHMLSHDIRPQGIRSVMTSSEMLVEGQRRLLAEAFGASVYNQYGSTECLSIAAECGAGSMHVNAEVNIVEFEQLDWTGDARAIVVTPLFNYGVPLLRYVLRDLGEALPGECACGRTLPRMRSLIGRSDFSVTLSDGMTVTPFAFEGLVARVPGIIRYQFRQVTSDSFDLIVAALPEATQSIAEALSSLDERFARTTGGTAHFTVRFVEDIATAEAGKHLLVVPLDRRSKDQAP